MFCRKNRSRTIITGLLMGMMIAQSTRAAPFVYESEESQIPKSPSQPPSLMQKDPQSVPHCERNFIYAGRRLECDSNLGRDGENLRSIIQDVPEAVEELNVYQENLKKVRVAAYVGTAGLLLMAAGFLMSHPPLDQTSGALRPGGYVILIGFGTTLNSLLYGLSAVKANEAHLSNAVSRYNAAYPNRSIELQFSTPISF